MEPDAPTLATLALYESDGSRDLTTPFHLAKERIEYILKSIALPDEDLIAIRNKGLGKLLVDSALGVLPFGGFVNAIVKFNSQQHDDIRRLKQLYFLETLAKKIADTEDVVSKLVGLVSNPSGSALFAKTLAIVDGNPPDQEHIEHVASALDYILKTNFSDLFQTHRYALSQIEQMTPQALTLLADNKRWPEFYIASPATAGNKIISDYVDEFAGEYAKVAYPYRVEDGYVESVERLKHSVSELFIRRYIEAHVSADDHGCCTLTKVGSSLIPYLYQALSKP